MFFEYSSLTIVPDISKWDTNKVSAMNCLFTAKLSSIPEIKNWNFRSLIKKNSIFKWCQSIDEDILKKGLF